MAVRIVPYSLENELHAVLWRIFLGGLVHDILKKAAPIQSARASEYGVLTEVEKIIVKARVLATIFPEDRRENVVGMPRHRSLVRRDTHRREAEVSTGAR